MRTLAVGADDDDDNDYIQLKELHPLSIIIEYE